MRKPLPRLAAGLAVIITALLMLAACGSHSGKAAADASSALANPATSQDIAQAKADVARCFPATPLQQVHVIHLVFLSSAAGKNGPAVTAARTQVFGCLGIPAGQRTAFKNDALTAAEHGQVYTKAGARAYLEVTLPALVLKYNNGADSASPGASVQASTTPAASPATTGASS